LLLKIKIAINVPAFIVNDSLFRFLVGKERSARYLKLKKSILGGRRIDVVIQENNGY